MLPNLSHLTIPRIALRIGALQALSPKDEKPGTAVRSDLTPQRLAVAATVIKWSTVLRSLYRVLAYILLMEEILHQLICSLSHYLQGFMYPRWCRISSINSRTLIFFGGIGIPRKIWRGPTSLCVFFLTVNSAGKVKNVKNYREQGIKQAMIRFS